MADRRESSAPSVHDVPRAQQPEPFGHQFGNARWRASPRPLRFVHMRDPAAVVDALGRPRQLIVTLYR